MSVSITALTPSAFELSTCRVARASDGAKLLPRAAAAIPIPTHQSPSKRLAGLALR